MFEESEGPDELYQALDAWTAYMRDVMKLARSSRKGKVQEATKLTAFLANLDLVSTREITAEALAAYTIQRYRDLADQTYNLYLSHLRMYVGFLRRKKLLGEDQNPEMDLMPRRRPEEARPKAFIYPEQIAEKAEKAGRWHDRDKYYVLFAFYMARRAGEVCALRWKDLDLTKRPGYPCGLFRFQNNKIGGDAITLPIDPLLLPYVVEWQARYQELLTEQFGLDERGNPERPTRPSDYIFPPLEVTAGFPIKGVRRPLRIVPEEPVPYEGIRKSLKKAGVHGIHSARRGGLISLDERFGIETARIMADHATQAQTAKYMNKNRQAESVGNLFAGEQAALAAERAPEPAPIAGVTSLTERRARSLRAV